MEPKYRFIGPSPKVDFTEIPKGGYLKMTSADIYLIIKVFIYMIFIGSNIKVNILLPTACFSPCGLFRICSSFKFS